MGPMPAARNGRGLARVGAALGVWLGLAAGCASAPAASAPPRRAVGEIRGGGRDTTRPAVVALLWRTSQQCSGTLIAPEVVLLAAHCVHALETVNLHVFFGDAVDGPGTTLDVAEYREHPAYDPTRFLVNDIALIRLSAPAPVPPVALALPGVGPERGAVVRLAGFGVTESATAARGEKKSGLARVSSTGALTFVVSPVEGEEGAVALSGDSGGPVLLSSDGAEVLVGVLDTTTSSIFGSFTNGAARVDAYRADFIDPFVAGAAASTPPPPPLPVGCADVGDDGRCEADVLYYCDGGAVQRTDCGALGQTCTVYTGTVSGCVAASRSSAVCADLGAAGRCDGSVLSWCQDDVIHEIDCGARGLMCGWREEVAASDCLDPPAETPFACAVDEYACVDGTTCIPITALCNGGTPDCPDGDDELGCGP